MAQHGGRRAGAGRPAGAKSKRTVELQEKAQAAAAAIEQALATSFAGDAHAYLMSVYKDPAQPPELRLEAARAAVRYEKPALASIDLSATSTVKHVILGEPLSPEERDRDWIEQFGAKMH